MVRELDDEAIQRIADRTRELMKQRGDTDVEWWLLNNAHQVALLAHCTWLATREELERGEPRGVDPIL
jgi:hypothetical protein